jgi:hypothetical protein
MIRKDELIMEKGKRELTIEELEKQLADVNETRKFLSETLAKKKKAEKEKKEAQLALEKENRKKEVDEAYETYRILVNNYVRDYGSYSTVTNGDDLMTGLFSRPWWRF